MEGRSSNLSRTIVSFFASFSFFVEQLSIQRFVQNKEKEWKRERERERETAGDEQRGSGDQGESVDIVIF
jgi:hypothetical protein